MRLGELCVPCCTGVCDPASKRQCPVLAALLTTVRFMIDKRHEDSTKNPQERKIHFHLQSRRLYPKAAGVHLYKILDDMTSGVKISPIPVMQKGKQNFVKTPPTGNKFHPGRLLDHEKVQRNSSMNSLWNFSILPTHSVPGARNVVLKWRVPSFCPNPLPGTMHTPVASSRRMQ